MEGEVVGDPRDREKERIVWRFSPVHFELACDRLYGVPKGPKSREAKKWVLLVAHAASTPTESVMERGRAKARAAMKARREAEEAEAKQSA